MLQGEAVTQGATGVQAKILSDSYRLKVRPLLYLTQDLDDGLPE